LQLKKLEILLSSVKLTIISLSAIGLTSILGTLIPQNRSIEFYNSSFSPAFAKLIQMLNLNDMYHSFWFLLLVALFSLNLIACTTKKIPAFFNLVHSRPGLKALFPKIGFFTTHTAILLILAGALLSSYGFKGDMQLPVGDSSNRVFINNNRQVKLNFTVRCDNFTLSTYKNSNRPKDYVSRLTILQDNREILSRDIEVNHPLTYRGVTIFQSSYGVLPDENEIFLRVTNLNAPEIPEQITARMGVPTTLADKSWQIRVDQFLPDFSIDADRRIINLSNELHNPAIKISILKNDSLQHSEWLFLKHPDFHGSENKSLYLAFTGISTRNYTGLHLTMAPGQNLIWAGCILLVSGLFIIFFLSGNRTTHKRQKTEI